MFDLDQITRAVISSKKYGAVCHDTVRRIASRELGKHGNAKSVIKATKRRLHQVYGAFGQGLDFDAVYGRLAVAYETGAEVEIKTACRSVLDQHSSTRERLPILEQFYAAIFASTGWPRSLLDLGCGLNPLCLPWMELDSNTAYFALDIDSDRVRFLNRYLALSGYEPLARCQDILITPPAEKVDLALLLKMSPSLERQEQGATLRLLDQLDATSVVVSFAVTSLGGREKGMAENYRQQFLTSVEAQSWPVVSMEFDTELVFVVTKQARG
jgi:16S rRNA (guanine(1405)-N(7))-methyltransferase